VTALLSIFLASVFFIDYLAIKLEIVNRLFVLIPEFLSLLIALAVVGRLAVIRQWSQPARYVWLFVAFILACLVAAVAQAVDPGPLVAGIRGYFKFLPLLFLPAVYEFSDKDIKVLLGAFLIIAGLQVPLAFYQRFVQFSHMMHTGDPITGTAATSSSLTMVLCLAVALVMTLYVYRKIKVSVALVLFCFLAAPTTINETKATLLLLPIAVLGPFFLAHGIEGKWRKAIPVMGICVLGLVAFAAVYNILIEARWGGNTINEFLSTGHYELYLYRGVEVGDGSHVVGRIDSIILPTVVLSDDWMKLLFGLGIGNASPSSLPGLEGAYAEAYEGYGFGMTAVGNLIWETGLIGLALYVVFFIFSWRDSRHSTKNAVERGWISAWWAVCILILFIALVYKSILNFNELGFMLFLWSGVIASRVWHQKNRSTKSSAHHHESMPRLKLAGVG
jgi:hypothetical protein